MRRLQILLAIVGISVLVPLVLFIFPTSWWKPNRALRSMNIKYPVALLPRKRFQVGKKGDNYKVSRTNDRASHLEKSCSRLQKRIHEEKVELSKFKHIIYNDKYKVLYCYIPKIATTNWKRLFLILSGNMNTSDPLKLRADKVHTTYDKFFTYLSDLNPQEIQYRLKNYFKFVIVREPFERLLSAFNNKFGHLSNLSTYFHNRFGKRIIKKYRPNAGKDSQTNGRGVEFNEFVQYIIAPERTEDLNEHWAHYHQLCLPCIVNYDFIGKYESLEEDSAAIINHIQATDVIKFPERAKTYKHKKTKNLLYDFYKQLSPKTLFKLWKFYYPDFLLFDYKLPKSLHNLTNFATLG